MREIIYIHLPTFYIKMQITAEPFLAGKPLVIEESGFVTASSPEAYTLGILPGSRRSTIANPMVEVRSPDSEIYRQGALKVWELVSSYSPSVEPDSFNGLFLDITGCGNPSAVSAELSASLWDALGLVANIGRGKNKFIAKLAAWYAPWQQHHRSQDYAYSRAVLPGSESSFLASLPVSHLWPLDPKYTRGLVSLGLYTIGDAAELSVDQLRQEFGGVGSRIHALCHGEDEDPVLALYPPPEISHEISLAEGIGEKHLLIPLLTALGEEVSRGLNRSGMIAQKLILSLETDDGDYRTAKWLVSPSNEIPFINRQAIYLLNVSQISAPVTKLTLRAEELKPEAGEQLAIFMELQKARKAETMDSLLSSIKERFGLGSIDLGKAYQPPRRELMLSRYYS